MEQQPDTEQTEPENEPSQESPAPAPDPEQPPVVAAAAPLKRRVALYVLASGERMGDTVAVYPIEGGDLADLALADTPEIKFQSKSRYSDDKEPGTWHWA